MMRPTGSDPQKARRIVRSALVTGAGLTIAYVGLGLYVIQRQIRRYAKAWEMERNSQGKLLYLALGDSTAQGIGATHYLKGYVGLTAAQVAKARKTTVRVYNISKTAATSTDLVRDQLPLLTALSEAPAITTVSIGSNDVVYGVKYEDSVNNLKQLLAALPAGSFIANIPPFTGPATKRATRLNKAYAKLVPAYGHYLVDIESVYRKQGIKLRYYGRDFFHPSDLGYKDWAVAFWDVIEPALRRTR